MASQQRNITDATPIHKLSLDLRGNSFYVKRDDLLPFSFGGNKARKVSYFFAEILSGEYDTVVTYGSSSSNHCRVVANAAKANGLACYIVSPEENYIKTYNSVLVESFGARIVKAPLDAISATIDSLMDELRSRCKPYFIQGGGHGNPGTRAYVDAYREICDYEEKNGIYFDYVFHASGTGTTQAGLVCGAALAADEDRKIVGISIARSLPRGGEVVEESVRSYLDSVGYDGVMPKVIFDDSYICGGYGLFDEDIVRCINDVMDNDGIPLNRTYTGKAYRGMIEYVKKNGIEGKNILFIHTGGCPLFFDDMGEEK